MQRPTLGTISLTGIGICLFLGVAVLAQPPRREGPPGPKEKPHWEKSPPWDMDRERPGGRGRDRRGGEPGPPAGGRDPPPGSGANETEAMVEQSGPEMYKLVKAENDLERRTREAAMKYRRAAKDQREEAKQELAKLVARHFEARQQRRKLELTRFENELKRLHDALDQREKTSRQFIDKRVADLLGEREEW
jgi:hypothetical protein